MSGLTVNPVLVTQSSAVGDFTYDFTFDDYWDSNTVKAGGAPLITCHLMDVSLARDLNGNLTYNENDGPTWHTTTAFSTMDSFSVLKGVEQVTASDYLGVKIQLGESAQYVYNHTLFHEQGVDTLTATPLEQQDIPNMAKYDYGQAYQLYCELFIDSTFLISPKTIGTKYAVDNMLVYRPYMATIEVTEENVLRMVFKDQVQDGMERAKPYLTDADNYIIRSSASPITNIIPENITMNESDMALEFTFKSADFPGMVSPQVGSIRLIEPMEDGIYSYILDADYGTQFVMNDTIEFSFKDIYPPVVTGITWNQVTRYITFAASEGLGNQSRVLYLGHEIQCSRTKYTAFGYLELECVFPVIEFFGGQDYTVMYELADLGGYVAYGNYTLSPQPVDNQGPVLIDELHFTVRNVLELSFDYAVIVGGASDIIITPSHGYTLQNSTTFSQSVIQHHNSTWVSFQLGQVANVKSGYVDVTIKAGFFEDNYGNPSKEYFRPMMTYDTEDLLVTSAQWVNGGDDGSFLSLSFSEAIKSDKITFSKLKISSTDGDFELAFTIVDGVNTSKITIFEPKINTATLKRKVGGYFTKLFVSFDEGFIEDDNGNKNVAGIYTLMLPDVLFCKVGLTPLVYGDSFVVLRS